MGAQFTEILQKSDIKFFHSAQVTKKMV